MSGAPKVRAMEIIDELEPSKRGIYSGAVGYLSFQDDMDTAIALRTAVVKDGMLYAQAGGGIVHDSSPDGEWQETLNKLRAVLRAAEMVQQGLDEASDPLVHATHVRCRRLSSKAVRGASTMLLMIDNYDSFTYNLVQYFGELGADVHVHRNDAITLDEVAALAPDADRRVAGPVHADRGRHLGAADPALRGRDPDPRRVPRAPGDRAGFRRPDRARAARDARQDSRRSPTTAAACSPACPSHST